MHKVAGEVQAMVSVPIVHIADATADVLEKDRITKVALLGTKYTMTEDFYKSRLIDRGFEVVIPDGEDIDTVNEIIFDELCVGIIKDESRKKYSEIIDKLKAKGAQAVILGCTEIGLLIEQKDSSLPIYDTTVIHAMRAAEMLI
jgi:aspartate racemase